MTAQAQVEHRIQIWPPLYSFFMLQWLDTLTGWLRWPFRRAVDNFLSCFFFTSVDLQYPLWQLWVYVVVMPVSLLILLLSLPPATIGCLLWLTFRWTRLKYISSSNAAIQPAYLKGDGPHICSFATANINLVPEWMARYNNFSGSRRRGRDIGRLLLSQQEDVEDYWYNLMKKVQNKPVAAPQLLPRNQRMGQNDVKFDTSILTRFPPVDVLLIQEACWDIDIARALARDLHSVYRDVIYDAGEHGFSVNKCVANSGLMVASKYPVLEVEFQAFQDFCKQDLFSSKGLLQVMVQLGELKTGEVLVGYIANTHLQAHQGTDPVHHKQLQSITRWTQEFRQRTASIDHVVMFDVVAGDFNLDNLSPVDERDWYNSLFNVHYRDLGRRCPGEEHEWTVGTEMRHPCIHDTEVSTPEGLKSVLESRELSNYYLLAGDVEYAGLDMAKKLPPRDEQGNYICGKNAGKRRIDFLLYKETDGAKPIAFSPVTQLANLTDHVPYTLALKLDQRKLAGLYM